MAVQEKPSPAAVVDAMPEVFVSRAPISTEVSRRVAQGRLRKLASRLYTRDLRTDAGTLVRTPEEAEEIIFGGRIPAQRPADAHDVLGVWRIVSDLTEMRRVPHSAGEFLDLLRERHAAMLAKRPDTAPGQFKTAPNRVGAVEFVRPDAVVGTLERGFPPSTATTTSPDSGP